MRLCWRHKVDVACLVREASSQPAGGGWWSGLKGQPGYRGCEVVCQEGGHRQSKSVGGAWGEPGTPAEVRWRGRRWPCGPVPGNTWASLHWGQPAQKGSATPGKGQRAPRAWQKDSPARRQGSVPTYQVALLSFPGLLPSFPELSHSSLPWPPLPLSSPGWMNPSSTQLTGPSALCSAAAALLPLCWWPVMLWSEG